MRAAERTPKGYRVSPMSLKAIQQEAQIVRRILQSVIPQSNSYLDIVFCVESMAAEEVFEVEYLDKEELGEVAAQVIPGSHDELPVLQVREDVYEDACNGGTFGRFTLAHELGHFFLHIDQKIALQRSMSKPSHEFYEDSEWQANSFAAALLVDVEVLRKDQRLRNKSDICSKYGVSTTTAKILLNRLK